jgi:cell division protein FtsL
MLLVAKRKGSFHFPEQGFPEKGRPGIEGKKRSVGEVSGRDIVQWNALLFCGLLLCLLLISVGLISQYGQVVAIKLQIYQVQREITELQVGIEQLQIEVNRLSSLERIEAIAKNDLGLQYPEKRQWLHLARGE